MKIFMKVLLCVTVLSVLLCMVQFESTCDMLKQDVLRLHILANSDADNDQKLKIKVRDAVLNTMSPLYKNINSKEDAKSITLSNLDLIKHVASTVVSENGYDYNVSVAIDDEFFDTRYYEEFTLPAGVYEALQIKIGEADGKNWWCVMYPALCVGASSKLNMKEDLSNREYDVITSDDYEFRFKIVEFFEKISLYFR